MDTTNGWAWYLAKGWLDTFGLDDEMMGERTENPSEQKRTQLGKKHVSCWEGEGKATTNKRV